MTRQEAKLASDRVQKYNTLQAFRDKVQAALDTVTEDWKEKGPCGQGPFTGNTRESRRVVSMHICFTHTLGGAPPVEMEIEGMHISAWDLGMYLERELRKKLDEIDAERLKI